jgi:hypothetical protein
VIREASLKKQPKPVSGVANSKRQRRAWTMEVVVQALWVASTKSVLQDRDRGDEQVFRGAE